jgi:hypothetical protein
MKMLFVLVALCLSPVSAVAQIYTELGGGFNGQLGDISNPLIVKSGVKVVRAFVDITRNYLTYSQSCPTSLNSKSPWCAIGVQWSNICDQPQGNPAPHIGCPPTTPLNFNATGQGISNVLPIYAISKLVATKSLGCQPVTRQPSSVGYKTACQDVKIVLSLKTDFTYELAQSILLDTTNTQQNFVIDAILALLMNGGLGSHIDYLVLGNEPMFEVPEGQAVDYQRFLVKLATSVNELKSAQNWSFEMYSGSLDRPGYACCPKTPKCTIYDLTETPGCISSSMKDNADAVIGATATVNKNHPNAIVGIDLHEHVYRISDIDNDVAWVNNAFAGSEAPNFKPSFISTEFSLILLWINQLNTGRPVTLCTQLNNMITSVAKGEPLSYRDYYQFLRQNPQIFSEGWFRRFYCKLSSYKFKVATYGLARENQYPYQLDLINGANDPINNGACLSAGSANKKPVVTPWVMLPAYNGALLGTSRYPYTPPPTPANLRPTPSFGYFNENPLVFPDFAQIVAGKQEDKVSVCQ